MHVIELGIVIWDPNIVIYKSMTINAQPQLCTFHWYSTSHMTGCNTDGHLVSRNNRKLSTSHNEENTAFVWFQVNLRKESMFILMLPVVFLENVLTKNSSDNFSSSFMPGSCNLPCSPFFFFPFLFSLSFFFFLVLAMFSVSSHP